MFRRPGAQARFFRAIANNAQAGLRVARQHALKGAQQGDVVLVLGKTGHAQKFRCAARGLRRGGRKKFGVHAVGDIAQAVLGHAKIQQNFAQRLGIADHAPQTWLWLFVLGLLTCYLAYICYGQGLKRISLVRAAVTCHLEPVLGTLWVWLFWDENFSLSGWFGGALVLGAVLLLTTDKTDE